MYGIVYLAICNATGKPYVGITVSSLRCRWVSHQGQARANPKWIFHRALNKYGADAFTLSILETCESREELHEAEVRWIARLGSTDPGGYNMTIGGGGTSGHKMTDEWKKLMSERMRGRVFSEETRSKMSAAKKGKPLSAEHAAKLGESRRGSKRTEETKRKMSVARRGWKMSAASIEKIRQSKVGTKLSASARAAISRPVIVENIEYPGVQAAAIALDVSEATIMRRIEKGRSGYSSLKPIRLRRKRTAEQVRAMKLRLSTPVTVNGVTYPSRVEAGLDLGITPQGVSYRVRFATPGRRTKLQQQHA